MVNNTSIDRMKMCFRKLRPTIFVEIKEKLRNDTRIENITSTLYSIYLICAFV
jgi:hypothetical protein